MSVNELYSFRVQRPFSVSDHELNDPDPLHDIVGAHQPVHRQLMLWLRFPQGLIEAM